jgi:hypothetical protein
MEQYTSLKDLILKKLGNNLSPCQLGDYFYESTCGFWTSFLIEEDYTNCTLKLSLKNSNFNLQVWSEEGLILDEWKLLSQFLSFNEDGTQKIRKNRDKEKAFDSIKEFKKLLNEYPTRKTLSGNKKYSFILRDSTDNPNELFIDATFLTKCNTEHYYADDNASYEENYTHWIDKCSSIVFGSIIEGSDVEPQSFSLSFPFSENDLKGTLKELEVIVTHEWKLANDDDYFDSFYP